MKESQMDYFDIENDIKELLDYQEVLAVVLVGSALKGHSSNRQLVHTPIRPLSTRDIDIFVILPSGDYLEREVVEKKQMVWDITYLPLTLLKQGINEKWPFLIQSLVQNKPLFVREKEVYSYLSKVKDIYEQGPGVLNKEEIDYFRFKLTQDYEDLFKRQDEYLNAIFLANNLFKEILVVYFKLNNEWVPKDKKLLAQVKLRSEELNNLCMSFLNEKNIEKKLTLLEGVIKYVLNPWGGKLKYWPKGIFPLK